MPSRRVLIAAIVAAATLALLAGGTTSKGIAGATPADSELQRSPQAAAERQFPTPERAKLRLRKTRFGKVIHETNTGLVAYLFTKERGSRSRCYGRCAEAWPPILTRRRPAAGSGLNRKEIGTTRRRGGAKMVTYKGRPLYFYEHDTPDLILCHDVREFGGDWLVVKRSGKPA